MKSPPRLRDLVEPVSVMDEDTPTAQVWRALEEGTPIVMRKEGEWLVLTPEEAVGYPRTRGLLDLPLRPVMALDAATPYYEALERVGTKNNCLCLVVEGERPLGVVHIHRLLRVAAERARTEVEEERRRQRIYRVLAERRPNEALERVFALLGEWLPVDHIGLSFVEAGKVRMRNMWVRPGWEKAVKQIAGEMFRGMIAAQGKEAKVLQGAYAEVLRSRHTLYLADLRRRRGATWKMLSSQGIRSALFLPLTSRKGHQVVVVMSSSRVNALSEEQRRFVESLQPTLSAAVEAWYYEHELKRLNAELEERVRQRTFELQVLYELAQQIGYTLNYDELLRLIVEHLYRVVDYDVAATLLITDGLRELIIYPQRPLKPEVERRVKNRLLEGFASLGAGMPDLATVHIQRVSETKAAAAPVERLGSEFMVPLIVGKEREVVGMLLVGAEAKDAFDEAQIRMLYTVAYQTSLSIQRLRALLAEEQRRLENLVERLPVGVVLLDASHRILFTNPLGKTHLSFFAEECTVGALLLALGKLRIEEVLQQAVKRPVEIKTPKEPQRIFEVSARRVEVGPTKGGHVLVLRDVTWERRLLASERARRQELSDLYQLSAQLVANDELEEVLRIIARQTVGSVHVTFCRVVLLEESGTFVCRAAHAVRPLARDLGVGRPEPEAVWPYYQQALSRSEPLVLQRKDVDPKEKAYRGLFLDVARSLCLAPLHVSGKSIGVLVLGEARHPDREPFDADKVRLTNTVADQAASAIHRAQLHQQLEDAYVQTVLALSRAMDARDTYTGDHSQRLAEWAVATARQLGCDEEEVEAIRWGAYLHDIGKIGVPDSILRKPGKLTDEEWEVVKRHPDIGAEIVAPVKKLARVVPIIRHHHERYDGSGYPDGLKGEEIPLGARILAVVDAYSAIVDERPYKPARTHEEAVAELRRCAGTHFDPRVVEAFLAVLGEQ